MKIAIFGATGKTGQHLVQQALDAGHEVQALVRTPGKLSIQHPKLKVIQGDIQQYDCVREAVTGVDAVVSALGPTSNTPDYIISKGQANILRAMRETGVERLVISAGAGVGDPHDQPKLVDRFFKTLLNLVSKHAVEDMRRVVDAVRTSDRDWTVVRVPMLTEEPAKGTLRIGYLGADVGVRLSRADMAAFMLKQIDAATWRGKAPVISN
jgi:putative NADH-flavin reductase